MDQSRTDNLCEIDMRALEAHAAGRSWEDVRGIRSAARFGAVLRRARARLLLNRLMICIFCLKVKAPSEEHVFPDAIGGSLTIDRVCETCNHRVNKLADEDLLRHPIVRMVRAHLKVPNRRGEVPDLFADILGVGRLVEDESQRVKVSDPNGSGLKIRVLYNRKELELPDGNKMVQIAVDASDADSIPRIIQAERKRARLPELPREELERQVAEIVKTGRVTRPPAPIHHRLVLKLTDIRRSLLKISYELAWYWLGDRLLSDPLASRLRAAILREGELPDDLRTVGLRAGFRNDGLMAVLAPWQHVQHAHLGFAGRSQDGRATIAVRVFNAFSAQVEVSDDADSYTGLRGVENWPFIQLDPIGRTKVESTMMEAVARLVRP